MSRRYVQPMSKGAKWALGITVGLVVAVVALTVTGLCLGHTSPIEFVKSWFVK